MEGRKLSENHMISAAAFVEGGVQDACDDTCSICLEAFCDSDPSTLTGCKHEFHLQCILEWCQRSSHCPMCWQPISLKDPSSQELLDAVEHERTIRMNPPRNTTIFHHPTLGDIELQHLPVSATESELEERIIQHLAAAAAMGRARHFARRESQRNRSSSQGRPHFLVLSTHPTGASAASSSSQRDGSDPPPATVMTTSPDSPFVTVGVDSTEVIAHPLDQTDHHLMATALGSNARASQHGTSSNNRRSPTRTSPNNQDRAGPSDFQSFSDTLKSRLTALSSRYRESITKSTRGWKERLFARNMSSPEPANEGRREADEGSVPSQGIATVTRMMDHLGIADDSTTSTPSPSNTSPAAVQTAPVSSPSPNKDNSRTPCAASSMSN